MKGPSLIKRCDYNRVIGMTKKEILLELGEDFNYYPDDVWTYILRRSWLGRKTELILFFSEDRVVKFEILKTWK